MIKNNMLFYLKPIVLFLDDEENFLESIKFSGIDSTEDAYFFSEVISAEIFLRDHSFHKINDKGLIMVDEGGDNETVFVHDIRKECLKLKEFHEKKIISVIFVDYSMPYEDGLSFSKRIQDKNVRKILLTGEIEADDVIDAFNSGMIDAYISKNDIKIREKIENILLIKHDSFLENINDQLSFVVSNCEFPKDLYKNELFENLLIKKRKEFKAEFSCVYESGGSQIFISKDGKIINFNIYSQSEIEDIFFESVQFEDKIVIDEKENLINFKKIADYKSFLNNPLISDFQICLHDSFYKIITDFGNVYYIVVSFSC